MKKSWHPGETAFPLDLWHEARRVCPLVAAAKHMTNRLSLSMVEIAPIHPFGHLKLQLKANGLVASDLTNQWSVSLTWEAEDPIVVGRPMHLTHAVMLLDGNLLTEEVAPISAGKDQNTRSPIPQAPFDHSKAKIDSDWKLFDEMLEERKKRLSRMNLEIASTAAKKYINEHISDSDRLELTSLCLLFEPVESTVSQSLKDAADQYDWVAIFSFAEPSMPWNMHKVTTLGDGTVLTDGVK